MVYFTSDVIFHFELNQDSCTYCMNCTNNCPTCSLTFKDDEFSINQYNCLRCEICKNVCPTNSIDITFNYGGIKDVSERVNQEIFITNIGKG